MIVNRRTRYWGQSSRGHRCLWPIPNPFVLDLVARIWSKSFSVPGLWGLIHHLPGSGANFPSCHHESAHPTRCWQFGLQREPWRKMGGRGGDREGTVRLLRELAFKDTRSPNSPGIPVSALSLSPCTRISVGGKPLSHGLDSLPFLLLGSLEKPRRIILCGGYYRAVKCPPKCGASMRTTTPHFPRVLLWFMRNIDIWSLWGFLFFCFL